LVFAHISPPNSLGISNIFLVLAAGQDLPILIDGQTDQTAELEGLVGFALFDDGHLVLVQTLMKFLGLLPL